MLEKIKGGLFGVAIGDALGGTTEFMSTEEIKREYGRLTEIVGGGCWNLQPGETTDDTAMTIAVARGILENPEDPIDAIGEHFLRWEKTNPKDIGFTVQTVFHFFESDWFQAAEKAHVDLGGKSAGNGSLMRCLPVAFAYSDKGKMEQITMLQSKMTHYDDLASEACLIYNRIARRLLDGESLTSSIQTEMKGTRYEGNYREEPDCPPDGFVVHTMKWVIYWLMNSTTFEEVVEGAANMGNDSDTIAAIAGGLKGTEIGYKNLPSKYKNALLESQTLNNLAQKLGNRDRSIDPLFNQDLDING